MSQKYNKNLPLGTMFEAQGQGAKWIYIVVDTSKDQSGNEIFILYDLKLFEFSSWNIHSLLSSLNKKNTFYDVEILHRPT